MLNDCVNCGKPRCSAGFLFCSDCDHKLVKELGANWRDEPWAKEYISSIRAEQYSSARYYENKAAMYFRSKDGVVIPVTDVLRFTLPGHQGKARGRIGTPDDYMIRLLNENPGIGYKKVHKRLLQKYGEEAIPSLSTIKRRLKGIKGGQERGSV